MNFDKYCLPSLIGIDTSMYDGNIWVRLRLECTLFYIMYSQTEPLIPFFNRNKKNYKRG